MLEWTRSTTTVSLLTYGKHARVETEIVRGTVGQSETGAGAHCFFFFQAEDGIRDLTVTGVQTCALPILGLAIRFAASQAPTTRLAPEIQYQACEPATRQPKTTSRGTCMPFGPPVNSASLVDRKSVV